MKWFQTNDCLANDQDSYGRIFDIEDARCTANAIVNDTLQMDAQSYSISKFFTFGFSVQWMKTLRSSFELSRLLIIPLWRSY